MNIPCTGTAKKLSDRSRFVATLSNNWSKLLRSRHPRISRTDAEKNQAVRMTTARLNLGKVPGAGGTTPRPATRAPHVSQWLVTEPNMGAGWWLAIAPEPLPNAAFSFG
ncbi:hypothetical protein CFAM422_001383 [Trichoderma lentiforme]|uniref:Uncharacterized protein n=1 Tax=Trichoderma lentiforme TaxID=1567552 RepID=A0A9P4XMY0_9HYPO|nr:hypothetical protein CFAM422_001383 [Trichoderma lentiforme]